MNNKPLAAKGHKYAKEFRMVSCNADWKPGDQVGMTKQGHIEVVRECFIEEFAHIDNLRKAWSGAVLSKPPLTRHYEVKEIKWQTQELPSTESQGKNETN